MKSFSKIIALMLVVLANGCDKQQEPAKTPEPAVFKTQQEAINKAKQVEGIIQDADEQHREAIDKQSE